MMAVFQKDEFRREVEQELRGNILPFWMRETVDRSNGGFYGALTNELVIHNEAPRSAILCARILWTYARASQLYGDPSYLAMAEWALDALRKTFWDTKFGGLFWSVDPQGQPIFDRKHTYAQAFGIYGLAEYYQATKDPESLAMAKELFRLLETYAHEPTQGGYIEGSSRSWETLEDMRLSERDMNCRKSMNTLLHVLEGYTNLLRVWDDPILRKQHKALIHIFLEKVVDSHTGHLKLFFDDEWNSLLPNQSFGHDIEASWLLVEAAELQADPALLARVRETAVQIARAVVRDGLEADGSLPYEAGPEGLVDPGKSWWVQAEAVVGFYNAYQISGDPALAEASWRSWQYIRAKFVDEKYGDWLKRLNPDGTPEEGSFKTGPWECPYHHSRMGYEMIERLS